jgi:hypothetical protein
MLRGLISLSHFYFAQGEMARGLELSRRCLELAATTQDAGLLAYARWTAGVLAISCGNLREGVSYTEGRSFDSRRVEALDLIEVVAGLDEAVAAAERATGRRPEIVHTSAREAQGGELRLDARADGGGGVSR